jgi:hypothetical protein
VSGSEPVPKGSPNTGGWAWVEAAAGMLGRDEREAVLGDLIEAGAGVGQAILAVLGLVLRREAEVWKFWRPWIAVFGLSMPCSFLLMGASLAVSGSVQNILASSHEVVGPLSGSPWLSAIPQVLLLVGWSWTAGFVAGSISRRTLWVSAVCCLLPCLFCFSRFRVESLSPFCLFLFLLPAVWGAREGLRSGQIKRAAAIVLAVAVTLLTITTLHTRGEPWWNPPRWLIALFLTWPSWYMAAISTRARPIADPRHLEQYKSGEETT